MKSLRAIMLVLTEIRKKILTHNGQYLCPQIIIHSSDSMCYLFTISNRGWNNFADLHNGGY